MSAENAEGRASASEIVEVDGSGLDATALLIDVAKSTRFLSRGTRVDVRSDRAEVQADLRAWAAWAGHRHEGVTARPDGALVTRICAYGARSASDPN